MKGEEIDYKKEFVYEHNRNTNLEKELVSVKGKLKVIEDMVDKIVKQEFPNDEFRQQIVKDAYNKGYVYGYKLGESVADGAIENLQTKLRNINNICDIVLDGATNWDEEQLEEFIKQIREEIK